MPVKFRTEQQERDFAIDDKYQYLIDGYKWSMKDSKYVKRNIQEPCRRTSLYLHRHILELEGFDLKGLEIDHANGNSLDNRVENLRVATRSQNLCNRGNYKNNTSGFKGVSWHNQSKSWRAEITANKKRINLGNYQCPKEAYDAYLAAAQKYHGEFSFENRSLSG